MRPAPLNLVVRLFTLTIAVVLIWLFTDANQGYEAPDHYRLSYGQFGFGTSVASAIIALFLIWQDKIPSTKAKLALVGVQVVLVIFWLSIALFWLLKYRQHYSAWDRPNVTCIFLFIMMSAWTIPASVEALQAFRNWRQAGGHASKDDLAE